MVGQGQRRCDNDSRLLRQAHERTPSSTPANPAQNAQGLDAVPDDVPDETACLLHVTNIAFVITSDCLTRITQYPLCLARLCLNHFQRFVASPSIPLSVLGFVSTCRLCSALFSLLRQTSSVTHYNSIISNISGQVILCNKLCLCR